eukprot:scaffold319173_cov35-Tisochrysis_lutea.AAC.2
MPRVYAAGQMPAVPYGNLVNWITFWVISHPVGTCQVKRATAMALNAICAERAESLPFCMSGTREAAMAQHTTTPAPAYRWGPGKSF